jgi:membrane associated rhomboid family serine protease
VSSPGFQPGESSSNPATPPPRTRKQQRRDELVNASLRPALHPSTPSGAVVWTVAALAVMWVLVLINEIDDHHLLRFGIKPRHVDGLVGIVVGPLLHANAGHLAANSIPFAVLCWLMLWSGLRVFGLVTAAVWLGAGAIDWITGPSHDTIVGISGVIFGWMGYVLARAFYGRSVKWIAIAVVVALVFSSSFAGLLPRVHSNVYWAGHVVGFVIGILIAAALHRRRDKPAGTGRTVSP